MQIFPSRAPLVQRSHTEFMRCFYSDTTYDILQYCMILYLYRISILGKRMTRQYRAQFFCRTAMHRNHRSASIDPLSKLFVFIPDPTKTASLPQLYPPSPWQITAINFCRWRARTQINATVYLTCDETPFYDPPPSTNKPP